MVLSRSKSIAIAVLAVIGMIIDTLLRITYERALLIQNLTECGSGCSAENIIKLPVLLGLHFAQLQWILFATQFILVVILLRQYSKKSYQLLKVLVFLHAGGLLLLFTLRPTLFYGAEDYIIATMVITVLSMLFTLKKKNKLLNSTKREE